MGVLESVGSRSLADWPDDGSPEYRGEPMIDVRRRLPLPSGASATYCSLPQLEALGMGRLSRLPVSVRILLESVLRHTDGRRIRDEDVEALARWQPGAARTAEVPFTVGRVLLQDFTGVPLLVDLAAMRSAIARRGLDVERVQPSVPVDLVVDHSVQVDYFGRADALSLNTEMERLRRRRHRSRGGDARPAGLPAHARRRGRASPRQTARRGDRDRPGAAGH